MSENVRDHSEYSPKELYIAPKYESLRDEIVNNKIHSLNIKQLNISITKATQYFHSAKAKKIYCRRIGDDLHYGIKT